MRPPHVWTTLHRFFLERVHGKIHGIFCQRQQSFLDFQCLKFINTPGNISTPLSNAPFVSTNRVQYSRALVCNCYGIELDWYRGRVLCYTLRSIRMSVCLSVCLSVRCKHMISCHFAYYTPPPPILCRGVCSFRLSVCPFVCSFVLPSVALVELRAKF